jgi:uncharacterized protein (UPF0332 family)
MDGSDFLDYAGKVAAMRSVGPAGYRSAVSRAYYGAFHLSCLFLEQYNFRCPKTENAHVWVQKHFLNCTLPLAAETGRLLADLHQSRKDADYDLAKTYADSQKNAAFCVARADEIRTRLQECATAPNIEQVRAEMLEFRKRSKMT